MKRAPKTITHTVIAIHPADAVTVISPRPPGLYVGSPQNRQDTMATAVASTTARKATTPRGPCEKSLVARRRASTKTPTATATMVPSGNSVNAPSAETPSMLVALTLILPLRPNPIKTGSILPDAGSSRPPSEPIPASISKAERSAAPSTTAIVSPRVASAAPLANGANAAPKTPAEAGWAGGAGLGVGGKGGGTAVPDG